MLAKVAATDATYTEAALSFMTPPHPSDLSTLKNRGAKMMVYHGTSDPIFSSDDTTAWYERCAAANGGDAGDFARFYRVPGMSHCSGGPATDQFDMLTPLVDWVEQGQAPGSVVAKRARRRQRRRRQRRHARRAGRRSRTRPAVPVPEGRALQRHGQPGRSGQLQLPVIAPTFFVRNHDRQRPRWQHRGRLFPP